jgi:exopolysaccharide biosynthesis polyprenyl glycosylphosphotransferase
MPDELVSAPRADVRERSEADDVVRAPSSASALNARGGSLRRLVVMSDTLALVGAFLLSGLVAATMHGRSAFHGLGLVLFAATLPAWLVGARLTGLYRLDERRANGGGVEEWLNIGRLMVIGTWAVLAIAWVARIEQPESARLVVFAALAATFGASGRAAARALARRRSAYVQNAVIVGAGEVGQLVARKLLRHPEYGVNLVGFVDTPPKRWRRDISPGPLLGPIDDLAAIVRRFAVDRVIVAFSQRNDNDVLAQLRPLAGLNVHVDVVPRMFEIIGPDHGLPDVEGIPLVSISPRTPSAASLRVKRAIDVVGACFGLVLTAPVFLWAAWRIPRETPGPVFYRQTRLGAGMREFTMLKFRTMRVGADSSSHQEYVERTMNGEQVADAGEIYKLDRGDVITPTGRWLRRTSLDELPQLLNVVRGTMSLVGPRPCLAYETEHFAPHHYERFRAPAGITGLWQVTARAHASFAEALEMDVVYVRSWSVGLDLSLLLRTPVEVLRQRKATA